MIRKIPETSQTIFNKYPTIFPPQEIREDNSKSCLAYGIECGPGWYPLIEDALQALVKTGLQIEITQIKEKFGQLRLYYDLAAHQDSDVEKVQQIIRAAERKSVVTCEVCGEPGEHTGDGGWYVTLCDTHLKERQERLK